MSRTSTVHAFIYSSSRLFSLPKVFSLILPFGFFRAKRDTLDVRTGSNKRTRLVPPSKNERRRRRLARGHCPVDPLFFLFLPLVFCFLRTRHPPSKEANARSFGSVPLLVRNVRVRVVTRNDSLVGNALKSFRKTPAIRFSFPPYKEGTRDYGWAMVIPKGNVATGQKSITDEPVSHTHLAGRLNVRQKPSLGSRLTYDDFKGSLSSPYHRLLSQNRISSQDGQLMYADGQRARAHD